MAAHGGQLQKSSLDSTWQRFITRAIKEGVITEEQRFALHDLKRRGITDTPGDRKQKQDASGHRDEAMLDIYDFSLPAYPLPLTNSHVPTRPETAWFLAVRMPSTYQKIT